MPSENNCFVVMMEVAAVVVVAAAGCLAAEAGLRRLSYSLAPGT